MSLAFIHKELPDGAYKAKFESEFYELKERKKVMYDSNKQLRTGLRYLIWSKYARVWYEREIDEHTLPDNIAYYFDAGWLWLWPTEENKGAIRDDVQKSKMGYQKLMEKRQLEIDHEHHLLYGNKADGYQFKNMDYRRKRYKS